MGQIYRFLGLSVDYIVHGKNDNERRMAYASDIVYGTNNELGFDYLRDNMKFSLYERVQRDFNFAIVESKISNPITWKPLFKNFSEIAFPNSFTTSCY